MADRIVVLEGGQDGGRRKACAVMALGGRLRKYVRNEGRQATADR